MDTEAISPSIEAIPEGTGPWIATFWDGPLADHGHDRMFAVGPIQRTLYLMPHPAGIGGYALVGMDGVAPDEPWPGQVRYEFMSAVTMAGADCEPIAYYRLVEEWE